MLTHRTAVCTNNVLFPHWPTVVVWLKKTKNTTTLQKNLPSNQIKFNLRLFFLWIYKCSYNLLNCSSTVPHDLYFTCTPVYVRVFLLYSETDNWSLCGCSPVVKLHMHGKAPLQPWQPTESHTDAPVLFAQTYEVSIKLLQYILSSEQLPVRAGVLVY